MRRLGRIALRVRDIRRVGRGLLIIHNKLLRSARFFNDRRIFGLRFGCGRVRDRRAAFDAELVIPRQFNAALRAAKTGRALRRGGRGSARLAGIGLLKVHLAALAADPEDRGVRRLRSGLRLAGLELGDAGQFFAKRLLALQRIETDGPRCGQLRLHPGRKLDRFEFDQDDRLSAHRGIADVADAVRRVQRVLRHKEEDRRALAEALRRLLGPGALRVCVGPNAIAVSLHRLKHGRDRRKVLL